MNEMVKRILKEVAEMTPEERAEEGKGGYSVLDSNECQNPYIIDTDELVDYVSRRLAETFGNDLPKFIGNYAVKFYEDFLVERGIMSGSLDEEAYGIPQEMTKEEAEKKLFEFINNHHGPNVSSEELGEFYYLVGFLLKKTKRGRGQTMIKFLAYTFYVQIILILLKACGIMTCSWAFIFLPSIAVLGLSILSFLLIKIVWKIIF